MSANTKVFIPRFGTRFVEDLRDTDVVNYQHDREGDGVSGTTINRETDVLMGCLSLADRMGWIERNPVRKGRLTRHPEEPRWRVFSAEEWAAFSAAFDDAALWEAYHRKVRRFGPRVTDVRSGRTRRYGGGRRPEGEASHKHRLDLRAAMDVFRALLVTGSRRSEILSLRWKQVDFKKGMLKIRLTKTEKKGLPDKTLPMVGPLRKLIKAQSPGVGEAFVFQRPGGGRWEEKKLDSAFKLALRVSDVQEPDDVERHERLTIHSTRHTASTWLVRADFSEPKRNYVLGHKGRGMAVRYTHLEPQDVAPLVEHLCRVASSGSAASGVAPRVARKKEGRVAAARKSFKLNGGAEEDRTPDL